jgi:hypothetical protein
MMLAVMSRAALGHTGRAIHAHPLTVAAYVLVSAAALFRFAAALLPDIQMALLSAAASSWDRRLRPVPRHLRPDPAQPPRRRQAGLSNAQRARHPAASRPKKSKIA